MGSEDETPIDVRVIAATNRDLGEEMKAGRFREDLYYRLNIVEVKMPPLREHKEDIPLFARHFLKLFSTEMKKPVAGFSGEALALMLGYNWPGNVRELKNAVERAVIFASPGELIRASHFPPQLRAGVGEHQTSPSREFKSLKEMELDYIKEVLDACGGNKVRAADILGVSPSTIWRKLQEEP